MLRIRKSEDRGTTRLGWLDGRHTFSFGNYYDPTNHHFRALRVLNDDRIAPGGGFPMHPHHDMEILTYVLSGELSHEDSMGNGSVIRPGEWQKMSAGTGVLHSEFNPSETTPTHLLQIWIVPDRRGLEPSYAQQSIPDADRAGQWKVAASPDGRAGSIVVRQDVTLSVAKVRPGDRLPYSFAKGRGGWLHVATGAVVVNDTRLTAGDAVAIEDESVIEVHAEADGEVLLFDLG